LVEEPSRRGRSLADEEQPRMSRTIPAAQSLPPKLVRNLGVGQNTAPHLYASYFIAQSLSSVTAGIHGSRFPALQELAGLGAFVQAGETPHLPADAEQPLFE
jgi:hypothetical protein